MSVLLLSGGMDSTLCMYLCEPKTAIGVNYGQPHAIELGYAARAAEGFGIPYEVHTAPNMPRTDDVVFAARNAALLSIAASVAQRNGYAEVIIGCNKSDATRFPDCRPEFIRNISAAFEVAYGVRVIAPLIDKEKAEIIHMCNSLGITNTWTCYSPTSNNAPCGKCFSCLSLIGE